MKKVLLISFFTIFTLGLSAQKAVRKNVRQGNKAYQEQRYGAAEEKYKAAIQENANSKEASYNLANTYYRQQQWDEAIKEYDHYLTIENNDAKKMSHAWSNIGNTYLKKKANEKSQQQAMQQQGQNPQQPQQPQEDNLKLTMEAYKNALRLDPTDDDTRYNLAVVQKMIKDREEQNKDQEKNKDQENKDDKKDQQQEKQDPKQEPKKDPKQDQKPEQQQGQMSQENVQQILQAIEQDEKATQERVKQNKAQERKQQNQNNRRQDKDW